MERVYAQTPGRYHLREIQTREHLSEKFLTQIYGVSRVTMREVIGQLATQDI